MHRQTREHLGFLKACIVDFTPHAKADTRTREIFVAKNIAKLHRRAFQMYPITDQTHRQKRVSVWVQLHNFSRKYARKALHLSPNAQADTRARMDPAEELPSSARSTSRSHCGSSGIQPPSS